MKHFFIINKCISILSISLLALISFLHISCTAHADIKNSETSDTIPSEFAELYKFLEDKISSFDTSLKQGGIIGAYKGVYAAEVLTSNGNRGKSLLRKSSIRGAQYYIDRLQELGINGVKVNIPYPMLTKDFADHEKYLDYYKQVATELKKRNMKLLIAIGMVFPYPFSTLPNPYKGTTLTTYQAALREQAETIVKEIKPDYLSLISEPDTVSKLLGFTLTSDNITDTVNYVLKDFERSGVMIGAGSGSWSNQDYINNLAEKTSLDFIDIHIYPANLDYLQKCIDFAKTAKANGKKVIIGEAWLYKTSDADLGGKISWSELARRDMFSFWAPLDQLFIKTIIDLAGYAEIDFVSFFWSRYFFSYVDYNMFTRRLFYSALLRKLNRKVIQNMYQDKFTETGMAYKDIITNSGN